MTRSEILAAYRLIRAGIQRVLREAPQACGKPDLTRALRQVAPWAEGLPDQEDAAEMIMDVALFEPNQRGRRAYDRFLAGRAGRLDPPDRSLAERMGGAWFSLFRMAGRHEAAGLWLEDLLDGGRRLWLVDESLEASAPEGAVLGMRLFDAGPFHAGFGIIAPPDEFTLETCLACAERGQSLPFRQSLAATLYGDALREAAGPDAFPDLLDALAGLLGEAPAPPGEPGAEPPGGVDPLREPDAMRPAPPRSAPRSRAARRSPRPRASPPRRGGSS
ncbi:hypothetical protein [Roseicella aerolata]|uniref:Uncharacterized protein n=1 Tax=Roseicella aerolata TaxID=2883479 RepID=A0A9X1ICI6_9PROT|nr:hypothetical protein [Roseicella aerolata]MCB4821897.1 hypothetical protein [Roseicella aerolata]